MQHLDCRISDEELRAIAAEKELARQVSAVNPEAVRASAVVISHKAVRVYPSETKSAFKEVASGFLRFPALVSIYKGRYFIISKQFETVRF